jgi:hypothetical protein
LASTKPKKKRPEFREYRRAVQATTFGIAAIIIAWLIASVAHSLFARPAVRPESMVATFSGRADDTDALLSCQADVETLFDDVNRKLFSLQALGSHYDIELAEQWEMFSKRWKQRRREVGARCRFEELRSHGLGAAYDRLAAVYDELEEVQRAYAVLLYNYIDHRASQVDDIRHALESSRKTFESQRAARGPTRQPG